MLYRIRIINDITGGLNLFNTYTISRLWLSFAILIYLEKLPLFDRNGNPL